MYYRTREQDRLAKSVVANKQASLSARSTPIKATKAHSMSFHEFSLHIPIIYILLMTSQQPIMNSYLLLISTGFLKYPLELINNFSEN